MERPPATRTAPGRILTVAALAAATVLLVGCGRAHFGRDGATTSVTDTSSTPTASTTTVALPSTTASTTLPTPSTTAVPTDLSSLDRRIDAVGGALAAADSATRQADDAMQHDQEGTIP